MTITIIYKIAIIKRVAIYMDPQFFREWKLPLSIDYIVETGPISLVELQ